MVPRVSVCIVTYNHAAYIQDCIMSVVAQANDIPLEILVGDDQSTDATEALVSALAATFPDLVTYFRHETRLGPGGNYQFLIKRAHGDYIAHLDGDDYWLPGKLAKQVALLEDFSDLTACYCNALCIGNDGEPLGVFNRPQPFKIDMEYLLKKGNFLNNSSLVYRAIQRDKIGEWEPDFLDYKLHLYFATRGTIGYVNILGVAYRTASATSMISRQGEHVRELYWRALCDTSIDVARPSLKLSASADFLSRVFASSTRMGSFRLFHKWFAKAATAHDGHKPRLVLLTILYLLERGYRSVLSRMAARLGGTYLRVFFWR